MKQIILASASPRRRELFRLITDSFSVESADVDESKFSATVPETDIPSVLAHKKAEKIAASHPDDIVIGCDTAVFINETMLGKPRDRDESRSMLEMLSGKTHTVITGCSIICGSENETFSVSTRVTFYELNESQILRYINTGEPADKAGSYGIQGYGSLLVEKIDGDYYNVVGLPVSQLYRHLLKYIQI